MNDTQTGQPVEAGGFVAGDRRADQQVGGPRRLRVADLAQHAFAVQVCERVFERDPRRLAEHFLLNQNQGGAADDRPDDGPAEGEFV